MDKDREFTPYRVITKGSDLVARYTDHYSIICTLKDLPSAFQEQETLTKWNLRKPGGWERYKVTSDNIADKVNMIVENEADINDVVKKFEKLHDKAKFAAFDKTKIKNRKCNKMENKLEIKELLQKQSDKIEEEILEIKQLKHGRCSKVFQMKSRISGNKKSNQEAHAIKDPTTGDIVVSKEEIKRVCLEYNCGVLKNNEPEDNFEEMIKIKEDLHDLRMNNKIGQGAFAVKKEDFDNTVKKFKDKKKATYDFLVKGGTKFKEGVYKLCKRMIENEEFPTSFDSTCLSQIYKGKGSKLNLSNSRFIHLKEWLPRTCDALVVGGMKKTILESSSIFQIGGQEGHRSQEHLFSLKSVMAVKAYLQEGFIIQLYDIRKFFDHESLRDVMDTLHDISINPKVYRAWFLMSQNTRISVKTGVGMTGEADVGEVVGQGTVGGALTSQVNIDKGVDRYFRGSMDEMSYGTIRLQPFIFQDDIARVAGDIRTAQAGNIKLSNVMNEKQLKVHPDKTGYIVVGNSQYREQVQREVQQSPIMFGNIVTKSKMMDKYLWDVVHMEGLEASVNATIEDRIGKITASMHEVKAIIDDYRMQALGGMMGALDLWNLAIIPSLMNNCSTWIGMTSRQEKKLESLQEQFIRMMMEVPVSTPKLALRAETGLLSMKHRVWVEKLNLVLAIQKSAGLAKNVYLEQLNHNWPGLAGETTNICEALGMNNVNVLKVRKQDIMKAVKDHDGREMVEEMKRYQKLDKIKEENPTQAKPYLETKSISDCRIIFRIRTEMMDLKDNMRGKYKGSSTNC